MQRATAIARALVEEFGLGGDGIPVCRYRDDMKPGRYDLSQTQMETLDQRIGEILEDGRRRAIRLLQDWRTLIETLRDMLLETKVIDAKTLSELVGKKKA